MFTSYDVFKVAMSYADCCKVHQPNTSLDCEGCKNHVWSGLVFNDVTVFKTGGSHTQISGMYKSGVTAGGFAQIK